MASIEMKVDRKLANNYVQVEATSKKTYTKYFKVPEQKADSFCADYKKHDKKMKRLSNISFIGATIAGCAIVSPLTKNLSSATKLCIGIFAGMVAAVGSVFCTAKVMEKQQNKLLKEFGAEEIFYDENKKLL